MCKLLSILTTCFIMAGILSTSSCRKTPGISPGQGSPKKHPQAYAGSDQEIVLPLDSAKLSGYATDADGNITGSYWRKIFGPASVIFRKPDSTVTTVISLKEGWYGFELTVTDNDNLTAKDTVNVRVLPGPAVNTAPYAIAGNDQLIVFPADSVELNGRGIDNEGFIASYNWSKISGPSSFNIVNPDSAVTKVRNLVQGNYVFELRVTDNGGLSKTDQVMIVVVAGEAVMNLSFSSVGMLSIPRLNVAVVAAGQKIFFAGGCIFQAEDSVMPYYRVDIFDASNNSWTTAELSEARVGIGAVRVGNKLLFAGGAKKFNYEIGWYNYSKTVDIYDLSSNTWSATEMEDPELFVWDKGCVGTAGDKALFYSYVIDDINEFYLPKVHIYDVGTGSWSAGRLSENFNKIYPSAASFADKVVIAGGAPFYPGSLGLSNRVDIYTAASNSWSLKLLENGRSEMRTVVLNNKAYFAGGYDESGITDRVEIFDNNSGTWSLANLKAPRILAGAAAAGNMVVFFGANWLDIYNDATNTWSVASTSQQFDDGAAFISVAGNIYFTNGSTVWKLQF